MGNGTHNLLIGGHESLPPSQGPWCLKTQTHIRRKMAIQRSNKPKLSNHFWKNNKIANAQITQTLKFWYAQYMGNHRKNIFRPLKFQNPNCTMCHKNDRDTWPHLLSICEHPYLKGLRIARHNNAVHLITQTLQANKHNRYYTLTNAGNTNNNTQEQIVPDWLMNCTSHRQDASAMPD